MKGPLKFVSVQVKALPDGNQLVVATIRGKRARPYCIRGNGLTEQKALVGAFSKFLRECGLAEVNNLSSEGVEHLLFNRIQIDRAKIRSCLVVAHGESNWNRMGHAEQVLRELLEIWREPLEAQINKPRKRRPRSTRRHRRRRDDRSRSFSAC